MAGRAPLGVLPWNDPGTLDVPTRDSCFLSESVERPARALAF
jgi:hypothetical protein